MQILNEPHAVEFVQYCLIIFQLVIFPAPPGKSLSRLKAGDWGEVSMQGLQPHFVRS